MNKKATIVNPAERGKWKIIILFLIVPILHLTIFYFMVNFETILLAFKDSRTGVFTFKNFVDFYESATQPVGNTLGVALKNTFTYFGAKVIIMLPLSLVMSYFLYKKIRGYKFYQTVFYFPALIPQLILVTVYKDFLTSGGTFDRFLNLFGGKVPAFGYFSYPETATTAIVVFTIITGTTSNILLFVGSMNRIPFEIIEASKLDGCSAFTELVKIILPLIWPVLTVTIIQTVAGILGASGPILLFTNGRADTTTISFWMFDQVYGKENSGYNLLSATGLVFTCIAVPLALFTKWLSEKVDTVEY